MSVFATAAEAQSTAVRGKIVQTEGNQTPACRVVVLKRDDNGALIVLRIPDGGVDNSILSTTLTALTTGLDVQVTYDPTVTTGCGSEPALKIVDIYAPGF